MIFSVFSLVSNVTDSFSVFLDQWSQVPLMFYSDKVGVCLCYLSSEQEKKKSCFVAKWLNKTTLILTVCKDHSFKKPNDRNPVQVHANYIKGACSGNSYKFIHCIFPEEAAFKFSQTIWRKKITELSRKPFPSVS